MCGIGFITADLVPDLLPYMLHIKGVYDIFKHLVWLFRSYNQNNANQNNDVFDNTGHL